MLIVHRLSLTCPTNTFQLIKCYNYTLFKNKLYRAKMRLLNQVLWCFNMRARQKGDGKKKVKYKDNHYDYINIDAVSFLDILSTRF